MNRLFRFIQNNLETSDLDGKASSNGKLLYRLNLMGQLKNSFRDNEFNDRFSIAPVLTYKFNDRKGLGINAGTNYMADRTTWAWEGATGTDPLPTYFKLNAGLFWDKNNIRITGNVFNVLDEYLYSGASYGAYYYWQTEAPRNYRLSINYRF